MLTIEEFISIFAPHTCLSCSMEGSLLCGWCRAEGIPPVPSRCYRCRKQTREYETCKQCRRQSKLGHVWVSGEYEGLAKDLVFKFKFERAKAAAHTIADLMTDTLPYLSEQTIVTFVPTATSRRRQRGYDQAELIARQFAKLLGVQFRPLLFRNGQSRQVGAGKDVRKKQLAHAFRTRNAEEIKGSTVLLMDDIVTSGATLEAAARVLKLGGAKRIDAIVFAQKR
jgi:ComF family protein